MQAVQRMKTSLFTAEETERFQEVISSWIFLMFFPDGQYLDCDCLPHALQGLRVYKLDLLSLWKFDVLHRDPSLLPRQLRIALGTQKSYKQDAARKEKRRISEAKKRSKTADLANWKPASDKEVCYYPGSTSYLVTQYPYDLATFFFMSFG